MIRLGVEHLQFQEVGFRRRHIDQAHLGWDMSFRLAMQFKINGSIDELNVDPVVLGIIFLSCLNCMHHLLGPLIEVCQIGMGQIGCLADTS